MRLVCEALWQLDLEEAILETNQVLINRQLDEEAVAWP